MAGGGETKGDRQGRWREAAERHALERAHDCGRGGIRHTGMQRIWAEAGLKPHLVKRFKISNDPQLEEKVAAVVGLYLDPADRALVLCVDEKSEVQALDRTQTGLPLKLGRAATTTHDCKRQAPKRLFATLDLQSGLVIVNPSCAIVPRSSFASCARSTGP